ncbi:hypothetical protein Nepgr_018400 [Nepenthes gracilis]|uniref:FRIGIDA-like protein n=1 Tax=Nepenthes gracilis TaxID=150966 RepID=A0AAD3XTZ9_NEPGR|nr:hypothetical protein Nepgr_018400 [Nepenthes gracilis]
MATEVIDRGRIQKHIDDLEAKKSILSTCSGLYKTLTSLFSSIEQSLSEKSHSLESKIQTLESEFQKSQELLDQRENFLPERESSLSAQIEAQKQAALAEFENESAESDELSEKLKSFCRKLDHTGLVKFVGTKRKESEGLRGEMLNALSECVDPPRLVLDAVEEFVNQKATWKTGGSGSWLTDKRWACAMVVSLLFSPEDLEGKKNVGPTFSGSVVERALRLVEAWKGKVEESGEGLNGVGLSEAAMFLQLMLGFGFKEKFDDEFLKKVVLEFATRKEMAKLAVPVFGERMGDIIDELVKNGKEIEAIYFASESGLTERFQPVALLKSYLRNSKKNAANILKSGNYTATATDEANNWELNSIRPIIRCVEEHKLEAEFPLDSLRNRLTQLEKAREEKKRRSGGGLSKPLKKRVNASGSSGGNRGPLPFRPAKSAKFYPPFDRRNPTRYSGSYYASQNSYELGPVTTAYGTPYAGNHIPVSAPTLQPHYALPVNNVGAGGANTGGSYGGPTGYAAYDYGAAAPSTYPQPSTYTL